MSKENTSPETVEQNILPEYSAFMREAMRLKELSEISVQLSGRQFVVRKEKNKDLFSVTFSRRIVVDRIVDNLLAERICNYLNLSVSSLADLLKTEAIQAMSKLTKGIEINSKNEESESSNG